ncbi:hypothetical protein [Thalassotalea aquiviva]|uniref:hypothetical protein n=1 Tax=Thalassotalea aquiviva TaxID=3242415 RepID=UPI00352B5191
MIASVTILYHPSEQMLPNFDTYIRNVDIAIFVDNSESEYNVNLVKRLNELGAIYLKQNGNLGIAKGLNIGIEKAKVLGATAVLTMDQDSRFETSIDEYIKAFISNPNVALMAPSYKLITNKKEVSELVNGFVMTSGNIINISDFYEVGGFSSELFIDLVDTDFCHKLLINHKTIKINKETYLNHSLGTQDTFFGIPFVKHPPIRNYYFCRNSFMLFKRFPRLKSYLINENIKRIVKALLKLEFKSIYFILKGLCHGLSGKFGKYNEQSN